MTSAAKFVGVQIKILFEVDKTRSCRIASTIVKVFPVPKINAYFQNQYHDVSKPGGPNKQNVV